MIQTVRASAGPRSRATAAAGKPDAGEAYALLATGTRDGAKAETWPLAREMYHRSLHLMEDLRDRGILDAEEIPEIETMKAKIAESDAALEERHQ